MRYDNHKVSMAGTVRKGKWSWGPQECVRAYFGTLGTVWDEKHSPWRVSSCYAYDLVGLRRDAR